MLSCHFLLTAEVASLCAAGGRRDDHSVLELSFGQMWTETEDDREAWHVSLLSLMLVTG